MNINPFEILKNAQKLREQMGDMQEKLAAITVTGSAGGSMVEVDMNGKMEILDVRIALEAVEDRDTELLEDLVTAAFTDAGAKAREAIGRELGSLAGGMDILGPGGFPGMGIL
ncbi:MAG: YbaB/EbfC family nucleoid-associated protein [Treponema sp.]|jgi:DNA-binding YbaB/EbfC family protein|nr:YbaB/EbfC family nucleoid-associated protein [Treponema sp.]